MSILIVALFLLFIVCCFLTFKTWHKQSIKNDLSKYLTNAEKRQLVNRAPDKLSQFFDLACKLIRDNSGVISEDLYRHFECRDHCLSNIDTYPIIQIGPHYLKTYKLLSILNESTTARKDKCKIVDAKVLYLRPGAICDFMAKGNIAINTIVLSIVIYGPQPSNIDDLILTSTQMCDNKLDIVNYTLVHGSALVIHEHEKNRFEYKVKNTGQRPYAILQLEINAELINLSANKFTDLKTKLSEIIGYTGLC